MVFARFDSKQKIVLGALIFVSVLVLAVFLGYRLKDYKRASNSDQEAKSTADTEITELRSQEEISNSYKQNMDRAINRLGVLENREEIVSVSQSSFFDIYVPTDLKDMHLQKMLEVRRLVEQADLSNDELKEKVIGIFNELLIENQKIVDSL